MDPTRGRMQKTLLQLIVVELEKAFSVVFGGEFEVEGSLAEEVDKTPLLLELTPRTCAKQVDDMDQQSPSQQLYHEELEEAEECQQSDYYRMKDDQIWMKSQ
eukprot:scaffold33437_cov68-Attheya_sp.AAC.9